MSLFQPDVYIKIIEYYCQNWTLEIYWRGKSPNIDILTIIPHDSSVCKFWHEMYINVIRKYTYVVFLHNKPSIFDFTRDDYYQLNSTQTLRHIETEISVYCKYQLLYLYLRNLIKRKFAKFWGDVCILSLEDYGHAQRKVG
jgi:hypothetical protein